MRSIWSVRIYLVFSMMLGWGPVLTAGWLDRQLEKAKGWTQFYKKNKGDYAQESYLETPDWGESLSKRWIGIGEDHTLFLAPGGLFYAGGEKSLSSFEAVKNAPKIKDIITSGKTGYALGDEGELYQWSGISSSGELGSLDMIAQGDGDASSAVWAATSQGVLRVDKNVATFYNGTSGEDGRHASRQVALPGSVASIASNQGNSVFLMDSGYLVNGNAKADIQFSSVWGDAVSLESTEDAVWVLTGAGSVWRVDEAGSSPVKLDTPLKEISAGSGHVLGLDDSGHVWSWGKNTHGQLGSGNLVDSNVPVRIEGLEDIVAIAAGYDQSFAMSSSKGMIAWGNNASGQLGIPNVGKIQLLPQGVHIAGVQHLSKTQASKAPVRIYFPQTGAVVGTPLPL